MPRPFIKVNDDDLDHEIERMRQVVDACSSESMYLEALETEREFREIEARTAAMVGDVVV